VRLCSELLYDLEQTQCRIVIGSRGDRDVSVAVLGATASASDTDHVAVTKERPYFAVEVVRGNPSFLERRPPYGARDRGNASCGDLDQDARIGV
jgi:hypothetical protein